MLVRFYKFTGNCSEDANNPFSLNPRAYKQIQKEIHFFMKCVKMITPRMSSWVLYMCTPHEIQDSMAFIAVAEHCENEL